MYIGVPLHAAAAPAHVRQADTQSVDAAGPCARLARSLCVLPLVSGRATFAHGHLGALKCSPAE